MHLKPIKEKINHFTKIYRPNTIWASDKSYPEAMLCKIARSIYMGCIVLGYAVFRRVHPKKSKLIPTIGLCKFKYICGLENVLEAFRIYFSESVSNSKQKDTSIIPFSSFLTRIGYHDHWICILQSERDTVCWTIEATKVKF